MKGASPVQFRCSDSEMMMLPELDLVLNGGSAVLPHQVGDVDIGIRDGGIAAIAPSGALVDAVPPRQLLQLSGLHILPGVIDSHVHFREPGKEEREDFESGTRGAVLGGVTTVFDMPNTLPSVTSFEALADKRTRVEGRAWCDYAFYVGADGTNTALLPALECAPAVCGIKVFMSSSTTDLMLTDQFTLEAVARAGNRVVSFHAEDDERIRERLWIAEQARDVRVHGRWRDAETALRATARVIAIARAAQRRVHILHVSTQEELELISRNKDLVSCEALPQHLTFSDPECYISLGSKAQQNPPIREMRHQEALWRAIQDGTVDVVASDHGPHTLEDKAAPYPNMSAGMPGTQTLVPLMLNYVHKGRLTLPRMVDLLCAAPARIFGIRRKGKIALGYDADFTIVDLKAERTITNDWLASKVGWTAYDGMRVTGWPVGTIIRGTLAMWGGHIERTPVGRPVEFTAIAGSASLFVPDG